MVVQGQGAVQDHGSDGRPEGPAQDLASVSANRIAASAEAAEGSADLAARPEVIRVRGGPGAPRAAD
jgi:hypothetical protein